MVIHKCECCCFSTNIKRTYDNHMKSARHIKCSSENLDIKFHTCTICSKKYQSRMGLWLHNQKCKQKPVTTITNVTNNISSPDITNSIMENFKKLQEQIALIAPSNITNNTTNNIININLNYLNTHCGNALNIGQFVESIVFTKDDYNEIAKNRCIAQGATNVLNKKLENLSVEEYPIHCSAVEINKPTIFFVRDKDRWNPESQSEIEYQQNTYEEDVETNVEKLGMMRFLEEFDGKLYDEYMELSKKDPNLKRIADKMFICGQSQTHIKMLREIPDKIESLILDPPITTNTNTDLNLLAT